ncbi:cupin domain-containing protein [Larsenimonas rhizosphaerae]|uniref:Cupin domain-containing protein n=1 Tax=Larsenimonas rhizosphaerae TaxID=2944682 RepID=A0AA42CY45_9GAMM|nr:cupin domain-containing protein [Larsenimonas rhizosphaerae]MCX2524663.1 cupin domain-containing protein [Larsenimonas rhizosphaerae]
MPHEPNTPLSLLGGLSTADFLRDYWQKKPLLIRGAYPDFDNPLSAEELAGLACEEGVEARLVEEHGPDKAWQVSHGPFDEATFARLGEQDWTLLVQAVDHYVPDVAALMEDFSFIPRWRLDDIMISYAPPGGNVGPHVDNYDVFLLQASGQRRWQLGGLQDEDAPLIEGIDLRILSRFEVTPDQDWVLEPGDMLYLPPRLAHHGVSISSDCMTISVGFRAPSADEMVTSFADFRGEQLRDDQRYKDPDLTPQPHEGEIGPEALARARELILSTLDNPAALAAWFGRYMTQPRYPGQLAEADNPLGAEALTAWLEEGGELVRALGSRFAYHTDRGISTLFIDGDGLSCTEELARALASSTPIDQTLLTLDPQAAALLAGLVTRGSLLLEDESEEDDD